jgi:hypothetical protein
MFPQKKQNNNNKKKWVGRAYINLYSLMVRVNKGRVCGCFQIRVSRESFLKTIKPGSTRSNCRRVGERNLGI